MDLVTLAATILVAGMVVLLALGVPIAISVGLPALAATVVILGWDGAVLATSQRMFTGINNFSLLAIPFFVFAGVLMNNGGIASRLVDAAQVVAGRLQAS
ncbi:MAG: TRAP transporter large permease subunit, partial [Agrococcus sp.]